MYRDESTFPASPTPGAPASEVANASDGVTRSWTAPRRARMILWAVVTTALFGYIAFGSVPAYMWRFGRLHDDARQVRGIWTIQAGNLPDVSAQWLMDGLFYGALVAFLVGVALGLWYLLSPEDSDASPVESAPHPDAGHTSA